MLRAGFVRCQEVRDVQCADVEGRSHRRRSRHAGCALVIVNWTVPAPAFLAMLFITRALHLVTTSFEACALSALLRLGEVAVGLVLLYGRPDLARHRGCRRRLDDHRAVTLGTNILAAQRRHPRVASSRPTGGRDRSRRAALRVRQRSRCRRHHRRSDGHRRRHRGAACDRGKASGRTRHNAARRFVLTRVGACVLTDVHAQPSLRRWPDRTAPHKENGMHKPNHLWSSTSRTRSTGTRDRRPPYRVKADDGHVTLTGSVPSYYEGQGNRARGRRRREDSRQSCSSGSSAGHQRQPARQACRDASTTTASSRRIGDADSARRPRATARPRPQPFQRDAAGFVVGRLDGVLLIENLVAISSEPIPAMLRTASTGRSSATPSSTTPRSR